MLTENDIINAVSDYLLKAGYQILRVSNTRQKGHDIIAERQGAKIFVEAKGETSSKEYTNRFGKPFNSAQIRVHVAESLYKAIATKQANPNAKVAIAFPATRTHKQLMENVFKIIHMLEIQIFFVNQDKSVNEID